VRELLLEMTLDIEFALKNFDREAVRQQADQRVHYLAHYDVLTGLPNRSQLHERARQLLEQARSSRTPMALVMLDLDHFKDINDSLGHTVGDALLSELALRLTSCLHDGDMVARLGGDEFIFVMRNVSSEASDVARKLLDRRPVLHRRPARPAGVGLDRHRHVPGRRPWTWKPCCSAPTPPCTRSSAPAATTSASSPPPCSSARAPPASGERAALCAGTRADARGVPAAGIVQDRPHHRRGSALRWSTPELGVVSPAEFIPAAEESGMIIAIGEWVLRQAVRQARQWLDAGLPPLVMAVNLSAVQFRAADLPHKCRKSCTRKGYRPSILSWN
jgi:diguanylate cyclase (GGDEF)-like protein